MFRLTVINNNYSDNNICVSSNSNKNNNYSDNNIYVSSNSNKQELF